MRVKEEVLARGPFGKSQVKWVDEAGEMRPHFDLNQHDEEEEDGRMRDKEVGESKSQTV